MKRPFLWLCLLLLIPFNHSFSQNVWQCEDEVGFSLCITSSDEPNKVPYLSLIHKGSSSVTEFFGNTYTRKFNIYIHPNRSSLDSTWQKDWGMPEFKSECWMVGSGIAQKLDLLSPIRWDELSCEHSYTDTDKTQALITHELTHVFHGQLNASPDFSEVSGIDWFVEGLAVYVSGQLDVSRIKEVKSALAQGQIPDSLENFWTGRLKYGLSGSVVMYIDKTYGRPALEKLLPFNNLNALLGSLGTSENKLLEGWKSYLNSL